MTPRRALVTTVLVATALTAACGRQPEPAKTETPSLNVTDWTDKTELYMEYPPLVTGRSALFAVHLTRLNDFTPLTAGRPRIEFTPEGGGPPTVLTGGEPSRPGAFRVEGVPPSPGRYRWALAVDAPGLADRHELGVVTVFADEHAADADAGQRPADDPAAIAYLKEQQWTNPFATEQVREMELGRPSECRRRSKRSAAVRRLSRAHVRPVHGGRVAVGRRNRSRRTSARAPGAASGKRRRSRDLDSRGRRGPGGGRGRQGRVRRARNACSRSRGSSPPVERRAASGRRGRRARLGAAEARAWPNETRRYEPAAAPRPATRSSCAPRLRAGWRGVRRPLARRTKGRRFNRAHRSGRVKAQVPAATRRYRDIAGSRSKFPDAPIGRAPAPSHSRRRRARSDDLEGAARSIRGRQPGRAAAHRSNRHAVLYQRQRQQLRCREPPCCWRPSGLCIRSRER